MKDSGLEVTQTCSSKTGIVVDKFNSGHLIRADFKFL